MLFVIVLIKRRKNSIDQLKIKGNLINRQSTTQLLHMGTATVTILVRMSLLLVLSPFSTRRICSREQKKSRNGSYLFAANFFANQSRCRVLVFASRRANKVAKWKIGFSAMKGDDCWIIDSGASQHMTSNCDLPSKLSRVLKARTSCSRRR